MKQHLTQIMKSLNNIGFACLVAGGLFLPFLSRCQTPSGSIPDLKSEGVAEVSTYPLILQTNFTHDFALTVARLKDPKTEPERYLALPEAAMLSFVFGKTNDARNFATELLALDDKFQTEPWRGGDAVFVGNNVLGRIAVQQGHIGEAKYYLLASGTSMGSPMLGSWGPNMSLAKDLIQQGERKSVLQYFELCKKFWGSGSDKLTQWAEDVKAGKVPDFGGNLYINY